MLPLPYTKIATNCKLNKLNSFCCLNTMFPHQSYRECVLHQSKKSLTWALVFKYLFIHPSAQKKGTWNDCCNFSKLKLNKQTSKQTLEAVEAFSKLCLHFIPKFLTTTTKYIYSLYWQSLKNKTFERYTSTYSTQRQRTLPAIEENGLGFTSTNMS